MQTKAFPFQVAEHKQLETGWEIAGYASTFGGAPDAYGDVIAPGCFAASIAQRPTKFLYMHEAPIGRQLELREDANGLFGRWSIVDTALGTDVHKLALAGVLDALSIGYVATDFELRPDGTRLLKRVDLLEVSLVAVPANERAVIVGVKSAGPDAPPAEASPADPAPAPDADPDPPADPAPAPDGETKGADAAWLDYAAHAAQITEFVTRTRQGAALRVKEGRAISTARRAHMAEVSGKLRQAADEIDALLAETAPAPKGYSPRLALAVRAARLRPHGVVLEERSA